MTKDKDKVIEVQAELIKSLQKQVKKMDEQVISLNAQVDMLRAQTDQWRASSEGRYAKGLTKGRTIDEIQIYNRTLSPEQIYEIYLAGTNNKPTTNKRHTNNNEENLNTYKTKQI